MIYVTLGGLPLAFELQFPFHKSQSGGDFYVLHGVVTLTDGSGLHANVAVQLTASMVDMVGSLDERGARAPVTSALRKVADRKELEFIKSTKLQPVQISSRYKNLKTSEWKFETASDEWIALTLRDRVYWETKAGNSAIDFADRDEQIYFGASVDRLSEIAARLQSDGWITIDGAKASATDKLMAASAQIEELGRAALEAIMEKHAFETAKAKF